MIFINWCGDLFSRQMQGGGGVVVAIVLFVKSKHASRWRSDQKTTFADEPVSDEAKEDVSELSRTFFFFLGRDPAKFQKLGGKNT